MRIVPCSFVALVLVSGCGLAVSPDGDAGVPSGDAFVTPMPDAFVVPPEDAFVVPPIDAGPPPFLCTASAGCGPGAYCNFGGGCGGNGADGTCTTVPTCQPETVLVCGCDGHEYLGVCAAHAAGTEVASVGGCDTTPPGDHAAAAYPSCGPTGGAAWTFTITGAVATCDDTSPGIRIQLFDALVSSPPGLTFDASDHSRVHAQSCPNGLRSACLDLSGMIVVDGFVENDSGLLSYDLVGHGGTIDNPIDIHAVASNVPVTMWCSATTHCR